MVSDATTVIEAEPGMHGKRDLSSERGEEAGYSSESWMSDRPKVGTIHTIRK